MSFIRKAGIALFVFYNKFQMIILSIFVLGLVDIMLYSDLLTLMTIIPAATPLIIATIIGYGVYKFFKNRNKRRS